MLVHEGTHSVIQQVAADDGTDSEGTVDAEISETLRTLGIEAAKNALAMSGIDLADVDVVICATSSPDDLFGDAPYIANAVGCDSSRVVAFDLTAACSGFLFGIVTAGQFLNGNSGARNALVLGADALTRWVDWEDRNSCILFGDGAGAMVLTSGDSGGEGESDSDGEDGIGVLGYAMHSNGAGHKELKCL